MEEILEIGDTCELEAALRSGNSGLAAEVVTKLAEQRRNISLEVNKNAPRRPEKDITINICIEDRLFAGTCIPLKVHPSTTFQMLGLMMYRRFEFPLEVQQWIVQRQKRIHTLYTTLSNLNIGDGDTIHLYLLSAYSVKVTREMAEKTFSLVVPLTTRQSSHDRFVVTATGRVRQTESDTPTPSSSQPNSFTENRVESIASPLTSINDRIGWSCPVCTFINEPTRPGCVACSGPKPEQYLVPSDYVPTESERQRMANETNLLTELEAERESNRIELLSADQQPLVTNKEPFECQICFDNIAPGDGVVLRDCLHMFCRECLRGQVVATASSSVDCPFNDGTYTCDGELLEREIKALVSEDIYAKFMALSVQEAESREKQSFHCRTPDCGGWCIYDDEVNTFVCHVCKVSNCLTCKAQHVGKTCRMYQDDLNARAKDDKAAKKTRKQIERMLRKGNAMYCPTCKIVVMKKDGCDWIRCTMCKTEICWVTKGPRWGPKGEGDESGGCHCGQNNKPCHPRCQNCH